MRCFESEAPRPEPMRWSRPRGAARRDAERPSLIRRPRSALDAWRSAAAQAFDLVESRHGRVTWRRHRQRTVSDAVAERRLGIVVGEESVEEPTGKRVAAADSV